MLCSQSPSTRLQALDSVKPGEKVNGDRCLGKYHLLVQQGWAPQSGCYRRRQLPELALKIRSSHRHGLTHFCSSVLLSQVFNERCRIHYKPPKSQ